MGLVIRKIRGKIEDFMAGHLKVQPNDYSLHLAFLYYWEQVLNVENVSSKRIQMSIPKNLPNIV